MQAALYDVTDPLLPVRGHGIIELARLVDIQVSQLTVRFSFTPVRKFLANVRQNFDFVT